MNSMRYPGPNPYSTLLRYGALLLAIGTFGAGFFMANRKIEASQQVFRPTPTKKAVSASPSTATTLVILRLIDGKTNEPIVGQPVVFVLNQNCPNANTCPTNPPAITTDTNGRLTVAESTILAKPKLYVAGYRIDSYFSFLKPDQPKQLTVYSPPPNKKATYAIDKEEVTISLTPLDQ